MDLSNLKPVSGSTKIENVLVVAMGQEPENNPARDTKVRMRAVAAALSQVLKVVKCPFSGEFQSVVLFPGTKKSTV